MLTVQEIWRYPVKSMGGERLDRAEVGPFGIEGDRSWGVRDLATGTILTGRREPRLLMATARLADDGSPIIAVDGCDEISTSAALSEWLDRAVDLVAAGDTPGTFENPMDVEHETDWISWQGPTGSFHDGRSTVSLVSTTSLADFEPRRFRMNLIVDGGGDGDLLDHDVRVGTATLHVRRPIDRCVMVTRAQPGIAADLEVYRRVVREYGNVMGVGAVVRSPGAISVGDEVG